MLGHPRLEDIVGLGLKYAECWKFRGWPIFLVKTREVETLMMRESFIRDDLHTKDIKYLQR